MPTDEFAFLSRLTPDEMLVLAETAQEYADDNRHNLSSNYGGGINLNSNMAEVIRQWAEPQEVELDDWMANWMDAEAGTQEATYIAIVAQVVIDAQETALRETGRYVDRSDDELREHGIKLADRLYAAYT